MKRSFDRSRRAQAPTSEEVVMGIEEILRGMLRRRQGLSLHELLWSVYARFGTIASAYEVNKALERVGRIRVRARGDHLELVAGPARGGVTSEDIEKAARICAEQMSSEEGE